MKQGALARACLLLAHFAAPLLFFTNLTRNPYATQEALLALLLFAASGMVAARAAFTRGVGNFWSAPKDALTRPWAAWIFVCAASALWALRASPPLFRPSAGTAGLRGLVFLLTFGLIPYALSFRAPWRRREGAFPVTAWISFLALWGGLWLLFPLFRKAPDAGESVALRLWDPYGAALWLLGGLGVWRLAREADQESLRHLALGAGFLAAAYGILQHFGFEPIWPQRMSPYGSRVVSTLGNPNFLSSLLVLLWPYAAIPALSAKRSIERCAYAAVFLALAAGLLCALTRSSWLGALAGGAFLACFPSFRDAVRRSPRTAAFLAAALSALVLLWPASAGSGGEASAIGRVVELAAWRPSGEPYSPWHQRLLIWKAARSMFSDSPFLGRGWGLFGLFYPVYQGLLLARFPHWDVLAAHADHAHNEFFEVFSQTGIVGLAVFLFFWFVFFRRVLLAARGGLEGEGGERRLWAGAAAAGTVGMLADNMLNMSLHVPVLAFAFWWQAGFASRLACPEEKEEGPAPRRLAVLTAACAVAAFALFGARDAARRWLGEVRYFIGYHLSRTGRAVEGLGQLEKAGALDPGNVHALYELGNAYARAGRVEEAIAAYLRALEADAGYLEVYVKLARLYARGGRTEAAISHYRKALVLRPFFKESALALASLYAARGARADLESGRSVLEGVLRFWTRDARLWASLGDIQEALGDARKASECRVRSLEADPYQPELERRVRAAAARAKGPTPPVLGRIDRLRALESRLQARDYGPRTLALAREALRFFPEHEKTLYYAGSLEMLRGSPRRAEALLRKLVAKTPNDPAALRNLAYVLKKK